MVTAATWQQWELEGAPFCLIGVAGVLTRAAPMTKTYTGACSAVELTTGLRWCSNYSGLGLGLANELTN